MALPAEKIHYTFADYLSWDEDERIELLAGVPFMMSSPLRIHQEIAGAIFVQLYRFLEGKKCRVYQAPFSVRLFEEKKDVPEDVQTVVEPDISVICDENKLDQYGCQGAPDFVIEVLSSSTRRHDRITKYNLYQQAGVREYWIIDPDSRAVDVFLLENGMFRPYEAYGQKDIAKVNTLEGCLIELEKVDRKSVV